MIDINRRNFVIGAGAVAGAGVSGVAMARSHDGRAALTKAEQESTFLTEQQRASLTCVRTPESVDGPYYIRSSLQRSAIAEGHSGVRLRLGITIANAHFEGNSCKPIEAAIVDVWHADAEGQYSNVGPVLQAEDTIGQTFCRGHQVTDSNGYVEFETIVPGWEFVEVPGPPNVIRRTTHIHVKVFSESKISTTQLYFPDEYVDELYAGVQPYAAHGTMEQAGTGRRYDRVRNGEDTEFRMDKSRPMSIERTKDGISAKATIGLVTLAGRGTTPFFR